MVTLSHACDIQIHVLVLRGVNAEELSDLGAEGLLLVRLFPRGRHDRVEVEWSVPAEDVSDLENGVLGLH